MTTYEIQEYCDFKNLKDELISRPGKKFSVSETIKIITSILEVLKFMHSKGACHRDIKPENILYDSQRGKVKLIDFDCSKTKKETDK